MPLLIHQPSYSMLNRWIEDGLLATLAELGVGCIAFSPLAQGLLTAKYLDGVPKDARAAKAGSFKQDMLSAEVIEQIRALNAIAAAAASPWRRWPSPGRCEILRDLRADRRPYRRAARRHRSTPLKNLVFSEEELKDRRPRHRERCRSVAASVQDGLTTASRVMPAWSARSEHE